MIEPKRRQSKARRDKRRAQTWKIALPNLSPCKKCGKLTMSHRMCKNKDCLTYNGREVLAKAE